MRPFTLKCYQIIRQCIVQQIFKLLSHLLKSIVHVIRFSLSSVYYHKQEVCFLLYLLGKSVAWQYTPNLLDLNWPCTVINDHKWQLWNCLLLKTRCVYRPHVEDQIWTVVGPSTLMYYQISKTQGRITWQGNRTCHLPWIKTNDCAIDILKNQPSFS